MTYEDRLPEGMTDGTYAEWYKHSRVVDGVRMGPSLFSLDALRLLDVAMVAEGLLTAYLVNQHFPPGSDCEEVRDMLWEAIKKV